MAYARPYGQPQGSAPWGSGVPPPGPPQQQHPQQHPQQQQPPPPGQPPQQQVQPMFNQPPMGVFDNSGAWHGQQPQPPQQWVQPMQQVQFVPNPAYMQQQQLQQSHPQAPHWVHAPHPQQQPPPPPPPHPQQHMMQHPSQQMSHGPPQPTYYQPAQQHVPHPMAQNPYMQYPPQTHPHYYPHHPHQMQPPPPHQMPYAVSQPHPAGPPPMYSQHPPPPPHPHPQSHPQPHWVHAPPPPHQQAPPPPPHPQQHIMQHQPQQIPHVQPQQAYYQPSQPPQHVQPPQPQQLHPPASPHHPPSRTHTPQHPPTSQTPTRVPPPSSTPASPSSIPKVEKKELSFPKNSVEATKLVVTRKRKLTAKDVVDIEIWRVLMCLKSGLLAESSWAIDVLSVLLNDDSTLMHFGLQHMPGLLEAVLEHFKCCLNEIFNGLVSDTTLKPVFNEPVGYHHWQEGNGEDTSHIQVYSPEASRRCTCISTIIRNLSFIPGNDVEMSKHAGLLLVLGRLLLLKHDDVIHSEADSAPSEWHLLSSLREDTLVIISNISSSLDLSPYNDKINLSLLDGLLHWACCSSSYALDPFPAPSITVSPQRLALESLAKLSIIEGNVDLILATPPWSRIEKLFGVLTRLLNTNEDQTIREFSLVLLSNLTSADSGIARKVALTRSAIPRLLSFLETSLADPDAFATTQDMLRRAAITLKCLSQLVDNHPLFVQHQQRLLSLVMSQKLDNEVVPIIADVIFEISLSD